MYAKFYAIGRLTEDPADKLRKVTSNGEEVSVCNFSIACDPTSSKGTTDFYDCVAWRGLADNLAKYMEKGKAIYVEGRPREETYEVDGVKMRKTKYEINTIKFVDRGRGNAELGEAPF